MAAYVINLDSRPDRLEKFSDRWASTGAAQLFGPVHRVRAVDASKTGAPDQFRGQPAAWGCLRSHRRCWECAMMDGGDAWIFEDDAVISDAAPRRQMEFVRAARKSGVLRSWHMQHLGGLHRLPKSCPPKRIGEGLLQVGVCCGTFAYGVSEAFLPTLYKMVLEAPIQTHIDAMIARLQVDGRINAYAPDPWIVGHDAGYSDITGRHYSQVEWWPYEEGQPDCPQEIRQSILRQKVVDGVLVDVELHSHGVSAP